MDKTRQHYFRCPYCGKDGAHLKKQSKSVGLFVIKELYNNVELRECRKCGKVHRIQKVGKALMWQDMSSEEKKVHQKKSYVNYKHNLTKLEDKNGKEI